MPTKTIEQIANDILDSANSQPQEFESEGTGDARGIVKAVKKGANDRALITECHRYLFHYGDCFTEKDASNLLKVLKSKIATPQIPSM